MNTVKVYRVRSDELVVKRLRCTQTGSTKLSLSGAPRRTLPYPHEAKAWGDCARLGADEARGAAGRKSKF